MSPAGERERVRLRDVARATNVSVKTVSRVVNEEPSVAVHTRARIEAALQARGYVPDGIARGLRRRRTEAVGVLIADIRNSFYAELVRAIEDRLHPAGLHLLLGNSEEEPARQAECLQLFERQRVDGLVVVAAAGGEDRLSALARRIPTVLVDRPVPGTLADTVLVDNLAAGEWLVSHLVDHHRLRTVVALGGDPEVPTSRDRLEAYHRVLTRAGLEPRVSLGHLTLEQAHRGALILLRGQSPPVGLYAINNRLLLGAVWAARDLGLRIPEDLAVVGVDRVAEAPAAGVIATCAAQPVAGLGRRSAELLLGRMADPTRAPRTVVLACQPDLGTSCGCDPAACASPGWADPGPRSS